MFYFDGVTLKISVFYVVSSECLHNKHYRNKQHDRTLNEWRIAGLETKILFRKVEGFVHEVTISPSL